MIAGKLFWRCFLASWATLIIAGALTVFGVEFHNRTKARGQELQDGPKSQFELDTAESVLRHAGPQTLAALLRDTRNPMLVIGPDGQELRGKPLSTVHASLAKQFSDAPEIPPQARRVDVPDGRFVLFVPFEAGGGRPPVPDPPPGRHPPVWTPLAFALLASFSLSALLAWYLARPVKRLREAFAAMGAGRLDTRVGHLRRRGDEFDDLGREFDRMAGHLQSLIMAQRRLLHDVSHELRSPLIRLQVAMGIVRQDPAKLAASLERMEREVQRLDGLIDEILTLSRLDSYVDRENWEPVDLGELVEEIVHDACFETGGQGSRVRLTERARAVAPGNRHLLARALENVIRNAIRYSPADAALDVEVDVRDESALIRVCDQGPGIPEMELGKVFEPFSRGQNASDHGGFGLGLAIARGAVRLHGGSISARNLSPNGLCVEILLPLQPLSRVQPDKSPS
jgi:two-component system OmpR family sensor kinase